MEYRLPSEARSASIRANAKQFKLLFVQLGAAFDPIRDDVISDLGSSAMTAIEFCDEATECAEGNGLLVLTELEAFADTELKNVPTLGNLRQKVVHQLEMSDVCLISRSPRMAFPNVPGSSLIEDAKFHRVPVLAISELPFGPAAIGSELPAVVFGQQKCTEVFQNSLSELGLSVLAALDHAIFESMGGRDFWRSLQNAELEAIRGAGFLVSDGDGFVFTIPQRFSEFREAVSDALADSIKPQRDLAAVMEGLWNIERLIRRALRKNAQLQFKSAWRKNVISGELQQAVLQRANGDTYLSARNMSELRDPIEWLTMGELIDLVRSKKFSGLGVENYFWNRFSSELVPIRNRISHMRHLKKSDMADVNLWLSQVKRML